MQHLQLIGNPARRRHRAKSRRRFSKKQRAAQRRFAAMARSRRRHHAPAVLANPVRHRRRTVVHVRSRRRRNPINYRASMGSMKHMFKCAGIGAAGALTADIAYGFASPFLPASMTAPAATGTPNYMYTVTKSAVTVLLGMALAKVPGVKQHASQMTEGALTVTFHDLIKQMVVSFGIGVPMGDTMLERIAPPSPNSQRLKMYPGGGGRVLSMYPGAAATSARESVTR